MGWIATEAIDWPSPADKPPPEIADTIAAVLAGAPNLPGRARCRDHLDVFDSTHPSDVAAALEVCRGCGVKTACLRWACRLPANAWPAVAVAGGRVFGRFRADQAHEEIDACERIRAHF